MQPSDDLDDLIRELNASTPIGETTAMSDDAREPASEHPSVAAASVSASASAIAVDEPLVKGDTSRLERWLALLRERRASDLLLVSGAPPVMRLDGRVVALSDSPLDGDDIQRAVLPALAP